MPRTKAQPPNPEIPADWRYETALGEVEAIVRQLEAGNLDLDSAFDQFTIAVARLQQCDRFLRDRQAQVSLAIETLDNFDLE
ncbi:MAG: exodeoxyribonuclease VII small subunit [Oscillatoriales cyanobacterium]|nr:MAG: exodeoxyribonuclease VII small subunit [Oscillatoriales cyanobacterium]